MIRRGLTLTDSSVNGTVMHFYPSPQEREVVWVASQFFYSPFNAPDFVSHPLPLTSIPSSRFSETETVVVLSMLIARYEISIQDEPQFRGETFEQKQKRVLEARTELTTTPVRVSLAFRRRKAGSTKVR